MPAKRGEWIYGGNTPTPEAKAEAERGIALADAKRKAGNLFTYGSEEGGPPKPFSSAQASPVYYGYDLAAAMPEAKRREADALARSAAAAVRPAPQADLSQANQQIAQANQQLAGAAGDINSARIGVLGGVNRLNQAGDLAPQQQALANQYNAVLQGNTPSLAELAMQRAAAAEARRNLAMASGVGGPGSAAALINAQNQNAVAQGTLQQNIGIQRAAEIAQAREGLGNTLGTMRQQTAGEAGVYGGLAGQSSNIAQTGGGLAATSGGLGQIAGSQAIGNAGLQAGQNALNQQGEQYFYGQGADWIRGQAGMNVQQATNNNNYAIGQQAMVNQAQQASDARSDAWLGAGLSAAGTAVATAAIPFTGGATAPLAAAGAANTAQKMQQASSDIRAKTAIAPAEPQISDVYRGVAHANDQAGQIRGAQVVYPRMSPFDTVSSSSYYYRDPGAPGADPGRHYGPMAQELERTPAGASVVTTMPDGKKGIDTGRLSLLNASETGQLRREVDALKSGKKLPADDELHRLRAANDRREQQIRALTNKSIGDLSRPTVYPDRVPVASFAPPTAAYPLYGAY